MIGGQIAILLMTGILELTFRANLHRAQSYEAMAIVVPLVLLIAARTSEHRWGATIVAATYTLFMIAALWLFPLFPAKPNFGPVYQHITHYIPLEFPPLVIVPAVLLDVVRARIGGLPRYAQAAMLGPIFVLPLVAVQWPFASFLSSDASHNWVFGTHYYAYFVQPGWYEARGAFVPDGGFASGIAMACVLAVIACFAGSSSATR